MEYDWLDKKEYPFTSHFFPINGHQLHFIDEGQGETILFIHGTPSWSFDFRKVIMALKSNYRCIAIDHIGFGLSDKPQYYDYSTQNHSNSLEIFIREKQLKDITLVVHDFGGPIGLHVAILHPHLFKNLVIMNSWLWSSKTDPDFIKFSKILKNPLLPFLYRYLNFSPRFILPKSFGEDKISARILKQYTKPFANHKQREGTLAFARSLLNDQEWFEELWNKRNVIANKPVLFIWGMMDPLIKPYHLEKFLTGFKNARVLKLETTGHFPQEEQADEVAKGIKNLIEEDMG